MVGLRRRQRRIVCWHAGSRHTSQHSHEGSAADYPTPLTKPHGPMLTGNFQLAGGFLKAGRKSQDRAEGSSIPRSESRKHRSFTTEQKLEIMLSGLRGAVTVRDACRSYEMSEALHYRREPAQSSPPGADQQRWRKGWCLSTIALPGDAAIAEVAKANPTDGTRMVAALASRALQQPVNYKRCSARTTVTGGTGRATCVLRHYLEHYRHRPHSGLGYRTPHEVASAWRQDPERQTQRPEPTTPTGSRSSHINSGRLTTYPNRRRVERTTLAHADLRRLHRPFGAEGFLWCSW